MKCKSNSNKIYKHTNEYLQRNGHNVIFYVNANNVGYFSKQFGITTQDKDRFIWIPYYRELK